MSGPRLLVWAAVLLSGSLAQAGAGPAPPVAQVIEALDAAQTGLHTLAADFVQHSRVKLFKQDLVSSGRFYFERAGRPHLRWDYLVPDPSTLLIDGPQVVMKMAGQPARVFDAGTDLPVRAVLDELGLWLGTASLRNARADHDISCLGTRAAPRLVLVPRAGSPLARTFTRVELRLDGTTWLLRSLLLVERSGDEKEIVFSHMDRNRPLPPRIFDRPG